MSTPHRPLSALSVLLLLAAGQVAEAQPACPSRADEPYQGEMRFTVQERGDQPPVLIAEGMVDANVAPRLRAALDDFSGDEIWLRSPGGVAGVDREAGHLIRQHRLRTRIPAGWACHGACTFLFFGGVERVVERGGFFVATMFAHTGDLGNVAEVGRSSQMLATADYDFVIRMGVSPRLLTDIMYRERAGSGRCLSRAELTEYRVTTRR